MILTQDKIRLLIQESLRRILFESEDELDRLKAEIDKKIEALENARSRKEFDQLNAEIAQLELQIQRTSKTLYKEPPEESDWDVFTSDPIQPVIPYGQPELVHGVPEDAIDITHGDPTMNRRDFVQNLGVGIGASALLGKQILDSTFSEIDPYSITSTEFARFNDAELKRFIRAFVDHEFKNDFAGSLESVHSGAVESISDWITVKIINQLTENALPQPQLEKLYNTLIGEVENSVMRYRGMP